MSFKNFLTFNKIRKKEIFTSELQPLTYTVDIPLPNKSDFPDELILDLKVNFYPSPANISNKQLAFFYKSTQKIFDIAINVTPIDNNPYQKNLFSAVRIQAEPNVPFNKNLKVINYKNLWTEEFQTFDENSNFDLANLTDILFPCGGFWCPKRSIIAQGYGIAVGTQKTRVFCAEDLTADMEISLAFFSHKIKTLISRDLILNELRLIPDFFQKMQKKRSSLAEWKRNYLISISDSNKFFSYKIRDIKFLPNEIQMPLRKKLYLPLEIWTTKFDNSNPANIHYLNKKIIDESRSWNKQVVLDTDFEFDWWLQIPAQCIFREVIPGTKTTEPLEDSLFWQVAAIAFIEKQQH